MATKVNAENNELIIRSDTGDTAIIPKNMATRVQQLMDAEDFDSVNVIVNGLPSERDYAEDGSLFVGNQFKHGGNPDLAQFHNVSDEIYSNVSNPTDPPQVGAKSEVKQGQYSVSDDIIRLKKELSSASKSNDKRKSLFIAKQLSEANRLNTNLNEFSSAQSNRDLAKETYRTALSDNRSDKDVILDKYGESQYNFLDKQKAVERGITSFDALKSRKYYETQGELQSEVDRLGTIISDQKQSFFSTKEDNTLEGFDVTNRELLDRQQELNLFSDGGRIKSQDGLVINTPTPEPIPEVIDDGNLEDGDKGKSLKKKKEKAFDVRPVAVDVANFPSAGLTSSEEVDEFFTSKVSDVGSTSSFNVNELQQQFGCTGSACRAVRHRFPELKNARDLLLEKGHTAFTGKGRDPSDAGFDAWEIHQALRQENLGTDVFTSEVYSDPDESPEGRKDYLIRRATDKAKFDPSKLAVGAIIGMGNAEGVYFDEGDEASYFYNGKKKSIDTTKQRSRHAATVVGFDDETGDAFIFDFGQKIRVGKSTKTGADFTWTEWMDNKNVNYITNVKANEAWTYKGLKQGKKQIAKNK